MKTIQLMLFLSLPLFFACSGETKNSETNNFNESGTENVSGKNNNISNASTANKSNENSSNKNVGNILPNEAGNESNTGNLSNSQTGNANLANNNSSGSEQFCGGDSPNSTQCDTNEFCYYRLEDYCGFADATGVCKAKSTVCNEIYAPVCGCDNKTYSNECEANGNGVSVKSIGECETTDRVCGAILNGDCNDGEFCKRDTGNCLLDGGTGICKVKPEVCDDDYTPVCGCDNKTYSNECQAEAAGVSIISEGECDNGSQKVCGAILNGECGEGEFCKYAAGECLMMKIGGTGICKTKASSCDLMYNPVCGCDNKTYSNECAAEAAGVSVATTGECASDKPNF